MENQDASTAETVLTKSRDIRQCADEPMSQLATVFDASNPEGPTALQLLTRFADSLRQIFTLTNQSPGQNLAQNPSKATAQNPIRTIQYEQIHPNEM